MNILSTVGRIILWTYSTATVLFWVLAWLGLPSFIGVALMSLVISYLLYHYRHTLFRLDIIWEIGLIVVLFLSIVLFFSVPLFIYHDGLPSGDSQKAIIWANYINTTHHLPDYNRAIALLNRDPVDFYTPGLHSLVAVLFTHNQFVSLFFVSLFAIFITVATAFIVGIMAKDISEHGSMRIAFLTILFVLTNIRFMRYVREPGYHLQNIAGELLLWGLVWVAITFRHRRRWSDIILGIVLVIALGLTHQFSSFMAVFMLIPVFVAFMLEARSHLSFVWRYHRFPVLGALGIMIAGLASALSLGLASKIPHIFSFNPHLLFELPHFWDYPRLIGFVVLSAGIMGWVIMTKSTTRYAKTWEQRVFISSAVVLLVLSQGPRVGIDIPPVRALFYLIVPLSIGAAFFFDALYKRATKLQAVLITVLLLAPVSVGASQFFNISHAVRTNSTLTLSHVSLSNSIKNQAVTSNSAVLIDDYNRRSASWLALSKQPMFTRIGADIHKQMDEAKQSNLRQKLYLNQLDFEKIFSLGNRTEIISLLDKHSIQWLTGIDKSSLKNFEHNPWLKPIAFGDDITLFERTNKLPRTATFSSNVSTWLLRSSTLVNDIGDHEDTFLHLPASVRTTRLSEPLYEGNTTWRETTAPLITIAFNIGDYVEILWDANNIGQPEQAGEFLVLLTESVSNVTLETPDGKQWPIKNGELVRIDAASLTWDEKGFINLVLHNPREQTVRIDLIALGLSRVP